MCLEIYVPENICPSKYMQVLSSNKGSCCTLKKNSLSYAVNVITALVNKTY